MIATTQAGVRQQGKALIAACFPKTDCQFLLQGLIQVAISHYITRNAVAQQDDVSPNRFSENEIVEGGNAIHFRGAYLQVSCNSFYTLITDPSPMLLYN